MAKLLVIIAFIALIIVIGILPGALQNPSTDIALLKSLGYTHIHQTGKEIFFPQIDGCGRDDVVLWTFSADNVRGQHVSVDVCQGIFKGATLRG